MREGRDRPAMVQLLVRVHPHPSPYDPFTGIIPSCTAAFCCPVTILPLCVSLSLPLPFFSLSQTGTLSTPKSHSIPLSLAPLPLPFLLSAALSADSTFCFSCRTSTTTPLLVPSRLPQGSQPPRRQVVQPSPLSRCVPLFLSHPAETYPPAASRPMSVS